LKKNRFSTDEQSSWRRWISRFGAIIRALLSSVVVSHYSLFLLSQYFKASLAVYSVIIMVRR